MLIIRLQRVGKKHQPSYRLAVSERRSKLTATPVEDLGAYDVKTKHASFNKDRVLHWITKGARPSVTAHNLLVREGVISGKKIQLVFKAKAAEDTAAKPAGVAAGQPAGEAVPAEPAPTEVKA